MDATTRQNAAREGGYRIERELDEALLEVQASLSRLDSMERLADTSREAALASEVRVRWDRYVVQSAAIESALAAGNVAEAERITSGSANDAFNAFNATAEALLLDNRQQFFAEVDYAVDLVRWLRWIVIAVTVAIAVLAWWGYSLRLREYQ